MLSMTEKETEGPSGLVGIYRFSLPVKFRKGTTFVNRSLARTTELA